MELPVVGSLKECGTCGRKILIERGLIGTDHTVNNIVTCWECLDKEKQQKAIDYYKLK